MSRSLKKRVAKLEERVDQMGGNWEFTIAFNPPTVKKTDTSGQDGKNQQGSSEPAKKPVPKTAMIYY